MLEKMAEYFAAEKQEALLFIVLGVLAIGIAVWLQANGHRLRAMAWPLVGIALIQLVVGGTVFLRTDSQHSTLVAELRQAPAAFRATELTRMESVMRSFVAYRWIEIALLLAGVLLLAFWYRHDVAAGVGAGLVLQSAVMLSLDIFAEVRGAEYLAAVRTLTP